MQKRLLPVLLLVFIAMACTRETLIGDKYVTFAYSQTGCADPWGSQPSDSLTLVKVADYLTAANLYIASLGIRADGTTEICQACSCKTGKVIYVSTLDSDSLRAQYTRIGFRLVQQ